MANIDWGEIRLWTNESLAFGTCINPKHMKKAIFACLLAFTWIMSYSQENNQSLKTDIVAIDIGFVGGWLSYERHMTDLFTLKSEVGLPLIYVQTSLDDKSYYVSSPSVKIEPRYYYNFNRRVASKKSTNYNAANYFALSAIYIPGLFTISNHTGLEAARSLRLIGKWGIKRIIGQRFNFEFAIGMGAGELLTNDKVELVAGLDLRFGYILW